MTKKLTKKQKAEMLNNAILIAEGAMEPTPTMSYVQAWQHLVDTGMAWELQGFFGRAASRMIAEGTLDPAPISQESEKNEGEQ
jgi:hypothetical protein